MTTVTIPGNARKELLFALDICDQAAKIALKYWQAGVKAEMKSDNSPVTVADKECEQIIRQSIQAHFPADAILGEEQGETAGSSENKRKWIIDPIDGTYNFARQIPIFSTLLALEENGQIVLGVIHAPANGDVLWAEKDKGAYKNGQKLQVSSIAEIDQSFFLCGGLNRILDLGYWPGYTKIIAQTYRQKSIGDYLNFSYFLQGKAEAVLEVGVKPWDLAPIKILTEEAGGKYSDLAGGDSIYTGSCLVANPHLIRQFESLLQSG